MISLHIHSCRCRSTRHQSSQPGSSPLQPGVDPQGPYRLVMEWIHTTVRSLPQYEDERTPGAACFCCKVEQQFDREPAEGTGCHVERVGFALCKYARQGENDIEG